MVKKDGFELRAIVALALLAGGDDAKLGVGFRARGLDLHHETGTAGVLPRSP